MFKFAAAEGIWPEAKLTRLFETIEVSSSGRPDRRRRPSATVVLRRRHRLRPKHSRRRDVPVDVVKQLLAECHNARDVLLLAVLATTGLFSRVQSLCASVVL
jgi:hypothetical protein